MSVITIGRICAQKDPNYFADALDAYRGERHWVWVGGHDPDDAKGVAYYNRLIEAGAVVTGWLTRAQVHTWLTRAHVYVHTAEWEGFPVTIMEAAAAGVPIVARDIPAVRHEGIEPLTSSPAHMAGWVSALDDEYQWRRGCARSIAWVLSKTQAGQRAALLEAYGIKP